MQNDKIYNVLTYLRNLNSLTILRDITEQNSFKALNTMLIAILNGDELAAEKNYHRLTQQLIMADSKRICGNIFSDYIIEWILEHENRFTHYAARGIFDSLAASALNSDIDSLIEISKLTTDEIADYIDSSSSNGNDRISAISSAVWSGRNIDNNRRNSQSKPNIKSKLFPWHYDVTEEPENSIDNSVFKNVYAAILSESDDDISKVLFDVFSHHGTGKFISNRIFISGSDNLLLPRNEDEFGDCMLPLMYTDEFERLTSVIDEFAEIGTRENVILTGIPGLGKSTMLFSLPTYITDLHFIFISGASMPNMRELMDRLKSEPLRFVIVIDDLHECDCINRFMGGLIQPDNVLIVASSENYEQTAVFDLSINLKTPDLGIITDYICDLSSADVDVETVRNLCMDHQIETKRPLTFNSIKSIMKLL